MVHLVNAVNNPPTEACLWPLKVSRTNNAKCYVPPIVSNPLRRHLPCSMKPMACFISMSAESTIVATKPATMPLPEFAKLTLLIVALVDCILAGDASTLESLMNLTGIRG